MHSTELEALRGTCPSVQEILITIKNYLYDVLVIFSIVLLNAALGFLQEGRAEQALSALRRLSAPEATVLRDGRKLRVPTREVTLGDLLIVSEGDLICADARLIESVELSTLEASLTGESTSVSKEIAPLGRGTELGDRLSMIYCSTTAVNGHALAVVTAIGMSTEVGKIAGMLQQPESQATPLQRELDRTGKQLGIGVMVIAAVVVGTMLYLQAPIDTNKLVRILLFGVALAVAAAPEGLATVVTVVLALGVQRMAKRGAIVRKLPAVESLGSATVIASDKTGTLTRNEMTVREVVTSSGTTVISDSGLVPEGPVKGEAGGKIQQEVSLLLTAAVLANNASLAQKDGKWIVHGDPTEGALLVAGQKTGLDPAALHAKYPRLAESPFSSTRKRMSTIHSDALRPSERVIYAKGAPGHLLDACTDEQVEERLEPLTADRREQILKDAAALASKAFRTLGVAYRKLDSTANLDNPGQLETGLVFVGLVGMMDPPRPETRAAIVKARSAQVRPIMITGDHPATALAVARELEITTGEDVITGAELESMTEEELNQKVGKTAVYARVNPEHKLRIVHALKRNGEIVAMTGDGVNDAMGITGTDVAKEAADLILTDDNFATIVAAIEEGRSVFNNIRKCLAYLLSSNAGEVLTVFLAVVFASPLGLDQEGVLVMPLHAAQILWINLLTDGAPALALGLSPVAAGLMQQPPRAKTEGVIHRHMLGSIAIAGITMALGTVLMFDAAMPGGLIEGSGGIEYGRTMAFTTLIFFQLFNAFNALSEVESVFKNLFANGWLWAAVCLSVVLHLLVIYLPFLQRAFGTVSLTGWDWLRAIVVASSIVWISEAVKLLKRLKRVDSHATVA